MATDRSVRQVLDNLLELGVDTQNLESAVRSGRRDQFAKVLNPMLHADWGDRDAEINALFTELTKLVTG